MPISQRILRHESGYCKSPKIRVRKFIALLFFLFGLPFQPILGQHLPNEWYKATALFENGNYTESVSWADSCIKQKANRYEFYLLKGKALYRQNLLGDAIENFTLAEKYSKGSGSFWLAKLTCKLNKPEECIKWTSKNLNSIYKEKESAFILDNDFNSVKENSEWKAIWEKQWYSSLDQTIYEAENMLKAGRYDACLDLLNSKIKSKNSSHRLYTLRGDTYTALEQYSNALSDYLLALKKSKRNTDYMANVAIAYSNRKQYANALKYINMAIDKAGNNPYYIITKAKIQLNAKQWNEAFQNIKFYLEFYPKSIEANNLLAQSAYESGSYVDALFALAKLIKLFPNNFEFRLLRAKTYIKTEQYRVALVDLDDVIKANYKVAEAYYIKGVALLGIGEKERACKSFSTSMYQGYFPSQAAFYNNCKQ